MVQPRKHGAKRSHDQLGAESIMQVGRMDHDFEHEPFILGHANVQTTLNTYTHVAPQMTQQAIHRVGRLLIGNPVDEDMS